MYLEEGVDGVVRMINYRNKQYRKKVFIFFCMIFLGTNVVLLPTVLAEGLDPTKISRKVQVLLQKLLNPNHKIHKMSIEGMEKYTEKLLDKKSYQRGSQEKHLTKQVRDLVRNISSAKRQIDPWERSERMYKKLVKQKKYNEALHLRWYSQKGFKFGLIKKFKNYWRGRINEFKGCEPIKGQEDKYRCKEIPKWAPSKGLEDLLRKSEKLADRRLKTSLWAREEVKQEIKETDKAIDEAILKAEKKEKEDGFVEWSGRNILPSRYDTDDAIVIGIIKYRGPLQHSSWINPKAAEARAKKLQEYNEEIREIKQNLKQQGVTVKSLQALGEERRRQWQARQTTPVTLKISLKLKKTDLQKYTQTLKDNLKKNLEQYQAEREAFLRQMRCERKDCMLL